jgi:hypothetical protein
MILKLKEKQTVTVIELDGESLNSFYKSIIGQPDRQFEFRLGYYKALFRPDFRELLVLAISTVVSSLYLQTDTLN